MSVWVGRWVGVCVRFVFLFLDFVVVAVCFIFALSYVSFISLTKVAC